jgi:hypothetical protein
MNKLAQISLSFVGIVTIFCAGAGLWYNATSFMTAASGAFDRIDPKYPTPYFYPAFYTMSIICILFFVALIFCSVQLLRRKLGFFYLYAGLLFAEVLYFLLIGILWLSPKLGMSIGAATGWPMED